MKPPDKYVRAYLASHLYNRLTGKWPERDWDYAILVVDPLYSASISKNTYGSSTTRALYRTLMDLHDI